jgi:hypothetical protein
MTLDEIDRLPKSRYDRYRDHLLDHLEYQAEAREDAQSEQ